MYVHTQAIPPPPCCGVGKVGAVDKLDQVDCGAETDLGAPRGE